MPAASAAVPRVRYQFGGLPAPRAVDERDERGDRHSDERSHIHALTSVRHDHGVARPQVAPAARAPLIASL